MDSLFNSIKGAVGGGDSEKKDSSETSNPDLLSSAKVVAEACQTSLSNQSDKVDKAKVAVAAAADDLLEASKKYGKLDDKQGLGQYVNKAEEYLHQYKSSGGATTTEPPPPANTTTTEPPPPAHTTTTEPPPPAKEESGAGVGDVFKMAEGFFKKN